MEVTRIRSSHGLPGSVLPDLSQEDLAAIEAKEFKILRLQWAKDLFVFSCYTGLSYCDLMALTKENISIGIDGEYWIMTSRRKTNQPVRVPLLPKALELIEKYKGHWKAIVGNYNAIFFQHRASSQSRGS